MLSKRGALSPVEINRRSASIFESFENNQRHLLPDNYTTVGLYASIRGEVETKPFFQFFKRKKKNVCFPQTVNDEIRFFSVSAISQLVAGRFGVPEPKGTEPLIPDVLFVPGVAFDHHCYRLGFGGGFYDRALAQWKKEGKTPRLLGLCYDFQLLETLPTEEHDFPVDAVISETSLRFRQA